MVLYVWRLFQTKLSSYVQVGNMNVLEILHFENGFICL